MPSSDLRVAFRYIGAALLACSLVACSGSDDPAATTEEPFVFSGDCTTVKAVPTFATLQTGFLAVCRGCHSSSLTGPARHNAPEGLDFETYELVSAVSDSAVLMVQNNLMPPPGNTPPTDSQKNQFYAWAACGKPR